MINIIRYILFFLFLRYTIKFIIPKIIAKIMIKKREIIKLYKP